jgi:hypothetical protein
MRILNYLYSKIQNNIIKDKKYEKTKKTTYWDTKYKRDIGRRIFVCR